MDWGQVSLMTRDIHRIPRGSALVVLVLLGMILVPVECDATTQMHSIFVAPSAVQAIEANHDASAHHSHHVVDHGHDARASGDSSSHDKRLPKVESDPSYSSSNSNVGQPTPVTSTTLEHTPAVVLVDVISRSCAFNLSISFAMPAVPLVGLDIRPELPPPRD